MYLGHNAEEDERVEDDRHRRDHDTAPKPVRLHQIFRLAPTVTAEYGGEGGFNPINAAEVRKTPEKRRKKEECDKKEGCVYITYISNGNAAEIRKIPEAG